MPASRADEQLLSVVEATRSSARVFVQDFDDTGYDAVLLPL